ncbi:MAG: peptide deformylase [Patescibacteria group bacterium]
MSMVPIVQKGDPVLRGIAQDVPVSEIISPKIKDVIKRMQIAMHGEDDAVAIAAPQIGEPVRIFLVSGKVFVPNYPDIEPDTHIPVDLVCINPKILKLSKRKKKMAEGCLSVRWLYGNVQRSIQATIEYYNEKGEKFERGAAGLLAQIFQHEIDHLDGILFIDKAEDIEDQPPQTHQSDEQ